MSDHDRRKAAALMSRAANATNFDERSRLINEAIYWHKLASGDPATGHDALVTILNEIERHDPD